MSPCPPPRDARDDMIGSSRLRPKHMEARPSMCCIATHERLYILGLSVSFIEKRHTTAPICISELRILGLAWAASATASTSAPASASASDRKPGDRSGLLLGVIPVVSAPSMKSNKRDAPTASIHLRDRFGAGGVRCTPSFNIRPSVGRSPQRRKLLQSSDHLLSLFSLNRAAAALAGSWPCLMPVGRSE